MITPTDTYPDIIEAKIINHKTGEEENLMQRFDSKKKLSNSLFKKIPIIYKEYEIRLRFDFKDTDKYGSPTLDADFLRNGKSIKAEPHHTPKTYNNNIAAYCFNFEKIELILILKLTITAERDIEIRC